MHSFSSIMIIIIIFRSKNGRGGGKQNPAYASTFSHDQHNLCLYLQYFLWISMPVYRPCLFNSLKISFSVYPISLPLPVFHNFIICVTFFSISHCLWYHFKKISTLNTIYMYVALDYSFLLSCRCFSSSG